MKTKKIGIETVLTNEEVEKRKQKFIKAKVPKISGFLQQNTSQQNTSQ